MASRLAVVLLAAASAVVMSACMGEGDEVSRVATATVPSTSVEDAGTTTAEDPATVTVEVEPPALTHAQLVRRLDRICRRGNRVVRRANERIEAAFARGDNQEAADIWERSKRRIDRPFYAAVEALEVPPRDERAVARYLEMTRQIDVLGTRYIRAVRQSDEEEMARLQSLIDRLADRRTLVTARLGLTECGS